MPTVRFTASIRRRAGCPELVVHPADRKTAWFVPAVEDEERIPGGGKHVVNRTRAGGQTFETLTHGLPQ